MTVNVTHWEHSCCPAAWFNEVPKVCGQVFLLLVTMETEEGALSRCQKHCNQYESAHSPSSRGKCCPNYCEDILNPVLFVAFGFQRLQTLPAKSKCYFSHKIRCNQCPSRYKRAPRLLCQIILHEWLLFKWSNLISFIVKWKPCLKDLWCQSCLPSFAEETFDSSYIWYNI